MPLKRRKAEKVPDNARPHSGITALIDMDVALK